MMRLSTTRPTGLREAHCHLPMLGRALAMIDVSMCRSLEELMHTLSASSRVVQGAITDNSSTFRADHAHEWMIAVGMRVESWERATWPTRHDLDRLFPDRPCVVRSFDFHSLVANTEAMRRAGITRGTQDPPAGVFQRDSAGDMTGVALEAAEAVVWKAVPEPGPEARRGHLHAALEHLKGLGFVEAHDLKSPAWLGPELATMADVGTLGMHIELYPMVEEANAVMRTRTMWECDQVRLGGFKLFADGTLNSRTAWMLHPYRDGLSDHPCGLPNWSPEQILEAVRIAQRCGVGLATHAIGDGAVRAVLDAIEEAKEGKGGERVTHRIEHCEVIDEDDVPRFARMGVVASVQPCHLLYDIPVLQRALPQRLQRVQPLRELIESGCRPGELLWFGSDAPIVPADPVASVAAAVGRGVLGVDGKPSPEAIQIGGDQAVSEVAAWKAFAAKR
jgi:predicted amidohydrolase YtcJ